MPRHYTSGLAKMFDEQVARGWDAPALSGYNQANEFIPKGKKREHKPKNKTLHIKGTTWMPGEWGFRTPEQLKKLREKAKAQREKVRAKQREKWRTMTPAERAAIRAARRAEMTPEKRAAIREKRKEMSEMVAKHHTAADDIVTKTQAFGHENVFGALQYVKSKLEVFSRMRNEKLLALREQYEGQTGSYKQITTELAKLKTPDISKQHIKDEMAKLLQFFDRSPHFIDYYNIEQLPKMTFLSTATSYFSMVRHEIMKAMAHKLHSTEAASKDALEFLDHYNAAQDLLGKLKRGWHTGMVGTYRVDAAEHNEFQERVMTAKFHEWVALHPNAKHTPRHVSNFDPANRRGKQQGG